MRYPIENLRSKSWDEFAAPAAPVMDLIVTVCDSAAGEACPVWLGHPATAHWGLPDPAVVSGSDEHKRLAFRAIHDAMKKRIEMLLALPLETLSRDALRAEMRRIGETAVLDSATEKWFPAR
jgi:arsenate reductase